MTWDRITDGIAALAATSSLWSPPLIGVAPPVPWLVDFNSAYLVPLLSVLGIVWLIVQIIHKIANWRNKDS